LRVVLVIWFEPIAAKIVVPVQLVKSNHVTHGVRGGNECKVGVKCVSQGKLLSALAARK
jgi:hypothetical protein